MSSDTNLMYWTTPETDFSPASHLHCSQIDAFAPLPDQFHSDQPKTVPDALRAVLFDSDAQPVECTYAILDAAKINGLAELLEASDLRYKCLFIKSAYDELRDVAPWLVQLKDDSRFVQNLFTSSKSPAHLWDKANGIFMRSTCTFDFVWRHFRKFTRVQNDEGKWNYFRFWDPCVQSALTTASERKITESSRLFLETQSNQSLCMYLPATGVFIQPREFTARDRAEISGTSPNALVAALMPLMRECQISKDIYAIAREAAGEDVKGTAQFRIVSSLEKLVQAGFKNKSQLKQLVRIDIASNFAFLSQVASDHAISHASSPYGAFIALSDLAVSQGYHNAAG